MTLLNLGPDSAVEHVGRVVPAGSDENTVYLRTLRPDEEDSGEVVHVPAGKRIAFQAGDLSIDSEDIDAKSRKGRGGYAPIADTIWTWYRMAGAEDSSLLMLLLAAARRLDASHVFWSETMAALEKSRDLEGIERRATLFQALAMAEVTVISLSRAVAMIHRLESKFALGLQFPENFDSNGKALGRMRNALEHIDERAMNQAKDGTADSAMSIFVQPLFVEQGVLTYAGEGLAFATGVLNVLIDCRGVLKSVLDIRPRCQATAPVNTD